MTQDIYNSIREILLCDEDIDFCCKLLLKITFDCNEWKWIQDVCIDIINSNRVHSFFLVYIFLNTVYLQYEKGKSTSAV